MFAVACLLGDTEAIKVAQKQHLDAQTAAEAKSQIQTDDFNVFSIEENSELAELNDSPLDFIA